MEPNVREIKPFSGDVQGAVMAMECGAILKTTDAGGEIAYQGKTYYATKAQCEAYKALPQVRHQNRGVYYIPKRMRSPWGEIKLYQSDEWRAKDV